MTLVDTAPAERSAPSPLAAAYGLSLLLVALATFAAAIVEHLARIPNLSLIFVLPVLIAAVSFGWRPAIAAAVTGVLAYNFFLIEPRYTLRVADPANAWALILLLAAAAIVSAVAAQARRRALDAGQAADQAMALQHLAQGLVAAPDRTAVGVICAEALSKVFKAPAVVLAADDDELTRLASAGGARLGAADEEAARWALASRLPSRAGAYPIEASSYDFWPVVTPQRQQAVIGVLLSRRGHDRPDAPERLVEVVRGYLAVALDRDHYAKAALATEVSAAGERLKADLLAAVSHDLKTPLSTILITLQSLRKFAGQHDLATQTQLLDAAERETARLGGLVDNLLNMNRLDAGAVTVRVAPLPFLILADTALAHAEAALAGHPLIREPAPDLVLNVDAGLFAVALGNVLENAGRYAPAGSAITLRAGQADGAAFVEVQDEGPGFPLPIAPLFEKFERGTTGDGRPPGTGLGLAIARGFLEAQGGRIEAENRDGGGACVRLWAPLA